MNQSSTIPSAIFVLPVALQTKVSLSRKFSRNLGSLPKMSPRFCLLREYVRPGPGKSFAECCGSTMLTAACYWPSSHCISAHQFVSASADLNHNVHRVQDDTKKTGIT